MALRDHPYLPLYVQDFLSDEKLMLCSAAATGVYIRLMCIMHKHDPYGTILLKQKFKQSESMIDNFASQLVVFLPYDVTEVRGALRELVEEKVLRIEGDSLIQKRMVNDAELSDIRANAGSLGGKRTAVGAGFAKANSIANERASERANADIENEDDNTLPKKNVSKRFTRPTVEEVERYCQERGNGIAARAFIDHYEAKGWMIGKSPMKDWKAAVRTWEKGAQGSPVHPETSAGPPSQYAMIDGDNGREIPMDKEQFDYELGHYKRRRDVEVELTEPNRAVFRRRAPCGTAATTQSGP